MRVLSNRLEYFDVRTGDTWSLFFPGYYERDPNKTTRRIDPFLGVARDRKEWAYEANGFNSIREYVSQQSGGRWKYSGETDIVLMGVWLPEEGDIDVDWESLRSGILVESGGERTDRTLGALIESISNSFDELLDPGADTGSLLADDGPPSNNRMVEFTTQVLSGIATAIVVHGFHLG
jgi:hypothetical protein